MRVLLVVTSDTNATKVTGDGLLHGKSVWHRALRKVKVKFMREGSLNMSESERPAELTRSNLLPWFVGQSDVVSQEKILKL